VTPSGRPRFALDQNFPTPIIEALGAYIVEAELVPLARLHPRLPTLDDWALLVALSQQTPSCAGLVTTDNSMLLQERELAVLLQTKLTLVVAHASGDDPLKATGLLLTHLPWIARQEHRHRPQLWELRTANKKPDDPWDRLRRIAAQQGSDDPRALYDRHRLGSLKQLAQTLLTPRGGRRSSAASRPAGDRRKR
jgi:hypothetical protein